jgi:hypothetical protein
MLDLPQINTPDINVGDKVTFLVGGSMMPRTLTVVELKGKNMMCNDEDWYWIPDLTFLEDIH